MRTRDEHLGIGVANLQQRRNLAPERLRGAYVIAHLDINFFAAFNGHEVYLLLIENADINLETTAHKFQRDHVLVSTTPIHAARAQKRVLESMVGKIVLFATRKIPFTANVIPAHSIERERVAKIPDKAPTVLFVTFSPSTPKTTVIFLGEVMFDALSIMKSAIDRA